MRMGVYFSISSFIVIGILTYIFYSKKRIINVETKTYGRMLVLTLFGLFLEIVTCYWYILSNNLNSVLYQFASKLTSSYYMLWSGLFVNYLMNICAVNNKTKKMFNILNIIVFVFIIILPINYVVSETKVLPAGPSIILTYFICFVYAIIDLIICLKYRKKIAGSKFMPVYVLLGFGGIDMMLSVLFPDFFLIGYVYSLIVIIMYFTIENPDMRLLQELHNSKKISDSANEEKTMFLYNMTQEIRNITGKIDDDADIILDSKDWEVTYDSARDIKANTSKFTNMTNEILDVSSIDAGSIKIYNSKYNIKNVLRQVVNVYGDLCRDKDLKFITNIDHDIPEVLYGDSIGLKEVLNIILSNSARYTDKGYVELSVNTIIKSDICRLIITIEDSGIGIKSEDINKIKVNNKSLAKANRLITTMNGAMMISSDYGVGTKVKLILDQKMEVENNSEASKYEDVFKDTNVLIVDDSEAGLKIMDKLLKGTKVKVDVAENGKECIDKIRVGKYDLILLDEELSQISGKELMGKIKEIRNFNIPVILLTKDSSYEYNEESKKIGFSDYIIKPIKKNELLEKINKNTKKDN